MPIPDKHLANLDGMFPEDLRKYARKLQCLKLHRYTNNADQLRLDDVTRKQLMLYARLKARAMTLRAKGEINRAFALEHNCDLVYQELPSYARW